MPNLKFLLLKTLYEWGLKSFTLSTYSLMDFLETINLCNYFMAGFIYFLFYSCFALLFFFDLYMSCIHFFGF